MLKLKEETEVSDYQRYLFACRRCPEAVILVGCGNHFKTFEKDAVLVGQKLGRKSVIIDGQRTLCLSKTTANALLHTIGHPVKFA